jgi:hypothetical protein
MLLINVVVEEKAKLRLCAKMRQKALNFDSPTWHDDCVKFVCISQAAYK